VRDPDPWPSPIGLRRSFFQELQLYLLQLVQALKFEGGRSGERGGSDSALAAFLTKRAAANPILGNYLLWYLIVEADEPKWNDMYTKVKNRLIEEIVSVRDVRAAGNGRAGSALLTGWPRRTRSHCAPVRSNPTVRAATTSFGGSGTCSTASARSTRSWAT